jgi:hypothetical protein
MNILQFPSFIPYIEFIQKYDISLSDNVIAFFDGIQFKIIPLKYLSNNFIIYTHCYVRSSSKGKIKLDKIDATISICPLAFNPIAYQGKLTISSHYKDNGYLILSDGEHDFYQFNSHKIDDNKKININKWECIVDSLYNIIITLSHYGDPLYLDNDNKKPFINYDFISNHLIYGIEYYSHSMSNINAIHFTPSNDRFNSHKNGFEHLYLEWTKKIHHHASIVHYTDLKSWIFFFPHSKSM